MIIYRIGIFLALILYINLKMGNDFIYEASEKFRTIVTDESFENVKTQGDLFNWIESSAKSAFLDSQMTYNNHPAMDQDMFGMMVFGIRLSQIREDYLMSCVDPMVKKGNPIALKLINMLGYNCSKSYNGMPWHPKAFIRQDEPADVIEKASTGEKCKTCPYFKQNNVTCQTSGDPFIPKNAQFDMMSGVKSTRYSFLLDSYYPDPDMGMLAASATILPGVKMCHWMDLKTKTVEVEFLFGAISTYAFGVATYRFEFNRLGIVKDRKININCLKNYLNVNERDMSELTVDMTLAIYLVNLIMIALATEFLFQFGNQICWVLCNHSRQNCCKRKSTRIEKTLKQRLRSVLKENHASCKWWLFTRIPGIVMFIYCIRIAADEWIYQGEVEKQMLNFVEHGFKQEFIAAFKIAMFKSLSAVSMWQNMMIIVISFYCLSMFEPFFKIPTFAVIPRTLVKAAPDTLYLIVTLVTLLLGFGTIMTLKFGAVTQRWSDPTRGLVSTYFMALGDLSSAFDEAYKLDPLFAFSSFSVFSMIISIVVINIFLSVVLDAYSQVKDEISEESNRPSMKQRLEKYKSVLQANSLLEKIKNMKKNGETLLSNDVGDGVKN
jgi:hypothetical protein